jgi:hypothetical protein
MALCGGKRSEGSHRTVLRPITYIYTYLYMAGHSTCPTTLTSDIDSDRLIKNLVVNVKGFLVLAARSLFAPKQASSPKPPKTIILTRKQKKSVPGRERRMQKCHWIRLASPDLTSMGHCTRGTESEP